MLLRTIIIILFFTSCKTGTDKKEITNQINVDSILSVDTNKSAQSTSQESNDSVFKICDLLFEARKDLVIDFYKNISTPANIKSKGDTIYHDVDVTILGDIKKVSGPIYKRINLAYDFDMFKVKEIYKGKMAKPNLETDPPSYGFRTSIREGCRHDSVNFAGHYTIIEWGCGTQCLQLAVVDRITGRVYYSTNYIPFDTADGHWGSQYRNDSRMIVVNSAVLEDYPGYCMESFAKPAIYEWKGNGFVKLKYVFKENDTTPAFNRDSSKHISQKDFDQLVDDCIKLLQTKKITEISNDQHIQIMMCLNTIFMHRLKAGRYEQLEKTSIKTKYTEDIIKVFPKWTPNRGMGYYFHQLHMELYGTPSPYTIYTITE